MRYFQKINLLKFRCTRAGFTLLEMAIGLVAVGMISAIILQSSGGTNTNEAYAKTRIQMADMQAALERFVQKNGYYPMPASATPNNLNRQGTSVASATTLGIINVSNEVLIGNFPYATVGLTQKYHADQFKNGADSAFRYVVSARLTDAAGYKTNSAKGVITVLTDKNNTRTTTSAAYAIISHGYMAGCSGQGGNRIVNCGNSALVHNLTFNQGTPGINEGTVGTSNYFDDLVVFVDEEKLTCSGMTVHWDGSANDTNATTAPCEASIPASTPLNINTSVTKSNTNPDNVGSALITCVEDKATGAPQKTKLIATGTCDCAAGQPLLWSNADNTNPNKCSADTTSNRPSTETNSGPLALTDEPLTYGSVSDDYFGIATARCVKGVTTVASPHLPTIPARICVQNCLIANTQVSWDALGNATKGNAGPCVGTVPTNLLGVSGGSAPNAANIVSDSALGATGTGNTTITCNNGILSATPGNCTSVSTGTWIPGACSASCGGGVTAEAVCSGGNGICDPATKPEAGQSCNTHACCDTREYEQSCEARYQKGSDDREICWVTGDYRIARNTCSATNGLICDVPNGVGSRQYRLRNYSPSGEPCDRRGNCSGATLRVNVRRSCNF